jgi:hypothetical protein
VRSFSATFLRLLETYGFLYRNRKNVIYSRNVIQNPTLKIRNRKINISEKENTSSKTGWKHLLGCGGNLVIDNAHGLGLGRGNAYTDKDDLDKAIADWVTLIQQGARPAPMAVVY